MGGESGATRSWRRTSLRGAAAQGWSAGKNEREARGGTSVCEQTGESDAVWLEAPFVLCADDTAHPHLYPLPKFPLSLPYLLFPFPLCTSPHIPCGQHPFTRGLATTTLCLFSSWIFYGGVSRVLDCLVDIYTSWMDGWVTIIIPFSCLPKRNMYTAWYEQ